MKRSLRNMAKPLNILIKGNNAETFARQKNILSTVLRKDTYTIYDIPEDNVCTQPWLHSCALMVYEGSELSSVQNNIMKQYLQSNNQNHGKIFFFNVDRFNSLDDIFQSMIVRECKDLKNMFWCESNEGKIVAGVSKNDVFAYSSKELIKILQNLGMMTKSKNYKLSSCKYGYVFSMKGNVQVNEIFDKVEDKETSDIVSGQGLKLVFLQRANEPLQLEEDALTFSTQLDGFCSFDWSLYKDKLKTKALGWYLMYNDLMTSTHDIFTKLNISVLKANGLAVTARQQSQGRGRSGNQWLSPIGCMMFSAQLDIPLKSNLGSKLPFVQHIAVVAFVQSFKKRKGYENLDINIKWPNDIYIKKMIKVGGVIVNSTYWNGVFKVAIGLGVNISNEGPTECLNSLINEYNIENDTNLAEIPIEDVLAETFNEIEMLISLFQTEGGVEKFKSEYYRHWLHNGVDVTIEVCNQESGRIVGLDDFGYLLVQMKNGRYISLQPDGNSFDMMKNMILIKK